MSHYATAMILRHGNPDLESNFYQVGKTNFGWITGNYQRDWMFGRIVFPINWKDRVDLSDLDLIELNKKLETFSIVSLSNLKLHEKFVDLSDLNMFKIMVPGVTRAMIANGLNSFNGDIPVAAKSIEKKLVTEMDHSTYTPAISAVEKSGGCSMVLTLPVKYNPLLFLTTILPFTYNDLVKTAQVMCLYTLRRTDMLCSACSRPAVQPVAGNIGKNLCEACISSVVLKNMK